MAHNPFKYYPEIAYELKQEKKNSRKYKKLLRHTVGSDAFFMVKMTDCLIEDADRKSVSDLRNRFVYESKNVIVFIGIGLAAILIAAFFRLGLFGETYVGYSVYALVAAIGTFPFIGFYIHRTHVSLRNIAEIYLDDFCITDKRFTPEYMQHLVDISTSSHDVILQNELDSKIPCGCYSCKSIYTSDRLVSSDISPEYVCPHCGKTTIISERCGEQITQELIDDLYEYWKE